MKVSKFLKRRSNAYKDLFLGKDGDLNEAAKIVFADLQRFCKLSTPSFVPGDPHATSLNEGRREVLLRIMAHVSVEFKEVSQLIEDKIDE